jgi:hypothetical protein
MSQPRIHMPLNNCKTFILLLCPVVLAACASTDKPPSANGGIFRQHNEGYSLLYKLMSDDSRVSGIFFLKHADESVGGLVKEIANFCDAAKKRMDEFPKSDRRIEFDVSDLPYMEQRSRDLQAKEDEKALLGSSGKEFELRLIYTQAQAMGYAVQLSDALAEQEDDPVRKSFLADVSRRCGAFHDSLMKLLAVKS